MNISYKIDDTCEKCNLCVSICPARIIKHNNDAKNYFDGNRISLCHKCGHCMAICPTKSVHVPDLDYEKDFFELPKVAVGSEQFSGFISSRRSVRVYKDKPVPKEILEKIINMISTAPMGFTPHKTEITIIPDRKTIEKALPLMILFYENMIKWMRNPIMRYIIRREAKLEGFSTIRNHVIPIMKNNLTLMKNANDDIITRGAPAMILFHAHKAAEVHSEDIFIALTYGLLAAHSLGLGAAAIDLVPVAVDKTKDLRGLFNIPDENEVKASIILGYPKYHFRRGIKRSLAKVNWV